MRLFPPPPLLASPARAKSKPIKRDFAKRMWGLVIRDTIEHVSRYVLVSCGSDYWIDSSWIEFVWTKFVYGEETRNNFKIIQKVRSTYFMRTRNNNTKQRGYSSRYSFPSFSRLGGLERVIKIYRTFARRFKRASAGTIFAERIYGSERYYICMSSILRSDWIFFSVKG